MNYYLLPKRKAVKNAINRIEKMNMGFQIVHTVDELFEAVKKGDFVFIDSVKDLIDSSSDVEDAIDVYYVLNDMGVSFFFIFDSFVEFLEKEDKKLSESLIPEYFKSVDKNTKARRKSIKRSKPIFTKGTGRPSLESKETEKFIRTKEIILKHSKEFGGDLLEKECISLAGVSKCAYYEYKKLIRKQMTEQKNGK